MSLHYLVPMHGFNYHIKRGSSTENFNADRSLRNEDGRNGNRWKRELKRAGLFLYGVVFGVIPIQVSLGFGLFETGNYATRIVNTGELNPVKQIESILKDGRCIDLVDGLVLKMFDSKYQVEIVSSRDTKCQRH